MLNVITRHIYRTFSLSILAIILCAHSCHAYVSWAKTNTEEHPGAADAIYCDLNLVGANTGHAAIFYQYDTTDGSRWVIQANGYSAASGIASWSNFLGGREYWGAYSQVRIDEVAREDILYYATNFCRGINYAVTQGYYKDPPNSLRCDGLVEYCYERAFWEDAKWNGDANYYGKPNQGIVPNDSYTLPYWDYPLSDAWCSIDGVYHLMCPELQMEWINNQATVSNPVKDDHDWGDYDSRQGKNSVNHNPVLSSGTVSPSSGYANSTNFTYSVHYDDEDLDVPVTAHVYIDGTPHAMSLGSDSGKGYNGTYQYTTTLSSGSHNYYFYFVDNQMKRGIGRLPSSGNYSGPIITTSSPALSVSPSDGLTSSGNQGGSFTPSSKQYSVSNSGGGTLSWTASANQSWVTVSPSSGTNSSGSPVTVSINGNANSLSGSPSGKIYTATVTFGGNGGSTTRQVSLTVYTTITPPTIPTSLSATAINSSQINLSWYGSTDSGGPGLAGYVIERSTDGITFERKYSTISTSYNDVYCNPGTIYYYRVCAYDYTYNYSDYSNTASATTPPANSLTFNVNPNTLDFGTSETHKSFDIIVTGKGSLDLSTGIPIYNQGTGWITSFDSINGTETLAINTTVTTPISVTISRAGLISGTYTATIPINTSIGNKQVSVSITVPTSVPLTIITASLPAGTKGTAYSQSVSATGGVTPYTWSISVGSLPTGLTINATTGAITGTPSAYGTSNFTVRVTDSQSTPAIATKALSIVISPAVTAVLTVGNVSGAPGSSVVVPISIATTGADLGPTTFGFDLLYDSTKFDTQSVAVGSVVTDAGMLLGGASFPAMGTIRIGVICTNAIADGVILNVTFKIKNTATPGEYILTDAGTLEVIDKNGNLIPASVIHGKITVTSISVPLTITTSTLPAGSKSTPYSKSVLATGGAGAYHWSKLSGSLPVGLTLNASTGVITGTPTTVGTFNFTVRVADNQNTPATADKAFSIVINPDLTIIITSLPAGSVGTAYNKVHVLIVLATGGVAPYAWSISVGSLPAGLAINTSTGVITGTPTTAGTFNFTVKVADSQSSTTDTDIQELSIVINPAAPVFSNLKFYNALGTLITGNILVDTPIKAKGDYTAGSDGSGQAMSQWVINDSTLADTVFVDTTDSDSCWLPANMLEPGKAYTLKGRAKSSSSAWSEWATLNFNTVLRAAAADKNGDGVPDDQTPTDTDIRITYGFKSGLLPDTALIVRFNNKPILVECDESDAMSYFASIARPLEAPPSGSNSYGVFTTRIEVLKGTPITLTYTFPATLPSGTKWYKYNESAPAGSKWVEYPDAVISGKTVTVDLKDGGKGDADGVANGIIVDPAGPVGPAFNPYDPNGVGGTTMADVLICYKQYLGLPTGYPPADVDGGGVTMRDVLKIYKRYLGL